MTKARDLANFNPTNITDTGTEGTKVALGTTAQRGSTAGQIRFNSTTGLAEYYTGTAFKAIDAPPTVSSLDTTVVNREDGGNQTLVITGSGFSSGATVTFVGNTGTNFNASTVTVNSETQITAVAPKASFIDAQEPYGVKVANISGLSNTLVEQINVNVSPTWSTASGTIATIFDTASGTHVTPTATDADGDAVTYAVQSGSLPAGTSLNASTGAISGDPTDVVSSTTSTFTLRATANNQTVDRSFNIIVNPSYDGSSSARASGSPQQIATVMGTTPTNGVYYFQNSGYNSGNPFQAYADWSVNSNTGYMILTQDLISGANVTNFTDVGTDSGSVSGTRGHNSSFREQTNNILSGWIGDTNNTAIVGQYQTSTGTSLGTASYTQWIVLDVSPLVFRNMFDNTPSGGEFTGTISARSAGGTGSFYWSKHGHSEYPNHLQMGNSTSNTGWNGDNYMEIRRAGTDTNHSFFVAGDGNGSYYGGSLNYNGNSANRVAFFGFAPSNMRT
jgi:hypothetical protein